MNLTAAFLGPPEGWRAVRLALRDLHGLWGGHTLDLAGSGLGWASVVDRAGHEQRFPVVVGPAAVAALLEQMIAADFLTLTFDNRPGVPDEARPEIALTNPAGETRALAKWANDPHPAFDALYQALLPLASPPSP
jgi:hypothetical protein